MRSRAPPSSASTSGATPSAGSTSRGPPRTRSWSPGGLSKTMDVEDCGLSKDDILLDGEQIAARMVELAGEIDQRYQGANLLMVGVLGGAFVIMADLCRAVSLPVEIDWLGASSYGSGSKSSGIVQTTKELETNVTGRHVLLVDDI